EPTATRCGEMVEQVGHRIVRTMRGDQIVARKRGPPLALAARDEDGLAPFIGEPIERSLDGEISAPLSLASARVRKLIQERRVSAGHGPVASWATLFHVRLVFNELHLS